MPTGVEATGGWQAPALLGSAEPEAGSATGSGEFRDAHGRAAMGLGAANVRVIDLSAFVSGAGERARQHTGDRMPVPERLLARERR
jgi:hypothetical protein